ncbi:hypothetical protein RRG08_040232 [Elysia crispata]|uniref:Uncharacterized protein n=1 Tax=Elysia crispata TaxID=231223 RepID=A0AAE1CZ95_9GAST|nr:hypothetical protein RRG08_040232 [Elysia crispata]
MSHPERLLLNRGTLICRAAVNHGMLQSVKDRHQHHCMKREAQKNQGSLKQQASNMLQLQPLQKGQTLTQAYTAIPGGAATTHDTYVQDALSRRKG